MLYEQCPVGRPGRITSVTLNEKMGDADCKYRGTRDPHPNKGSYGFNSNIDIIWADRNCRGRFDVCLEGKVNERSVIV